MENNRISKLYIINFIKAVKEYVLNPLKGVKL